MEQERLIFHVDVNSAFLSWEAAKPSEGRASGSAGDPFCGGRRSKARAQGIVVAKSIPAKKYGVQYRGACRPWLFRKCPELVVVPGDFRLLYREFHGL